MDASSSTFDTHVRAISVFKIKEKAKYEWKLDGVGLLMIQLTNFSEHSVISPDFTRNNPHSTLKYLELKLYGNKSNDAGRVSLSFTLNRMKMNNLGLTLFHFYLVDKDGKSLNSKFTLQSKCDITVTIDQFCRSSQLCDLVNHLFIQIVCELLTFSEDLENVIIDRPRPENCIPENSFKDDLKNKNDGEVTFIVGDKELKAHKHVLINRCCVFARMFESNMIEAKQNKVEITDARPEIFEKMIDFLYTDAVEGSLDKKDAADLLNVADKYQLNYLKKICQTSLLIALAKENAELFLSICQKISSITT